MAPNFLDFLLLIFIISCYFLSSLRGGGKQLFSFFLIIVSFVIAGRYYWDIGGVFPEKVFPESFSGTAGFVIIFLLAFGALSFILRLFDGVFKILHFGGIDRIVSITIGILKGLVLGCMTVIILMINYPADKPILRNSLTCPYLLPEAGKLVKLLPSKEQKEYFSTERELKKLWRKK